MNDIYIPWDWLMFFFLVVANFYSWKFLLQENNKTLFLYKFIIKPVMLIACGAALTLFILAFHYANYVKSSNVGLVKTAKAEYVGYITKHPFRDTMTVYTTPKYPILNCPTLSDDTPMCTQELIEIKKDDVVSIEIF